MRLGILNEFLDKHNPYITACEELKVDFEVVDIITSDWIKNIEKSQCDGFLVRPSSNKETWVRFYDERIYFINKYMGKPVYPSLKEIYIYENKRNMAYWLKINKIPHPQTWIFYRKEEAINFVKNTASFPLVFKPIFGSGGRGIKIINEKKQALRLIDKIFTRWKFFNRGYTKWYKTKYGLSYPLMDDKQHNNILFQEAIDISCEWRGVKIGNSYFAHKKMIAKNGLYSGSGKADYITPPFKVMDFIKFVCDKGNFNSMNIDFFEDKQGNFFVSELQTFFGSKIKPYQMCVDGVPGRYLLDGGNWVFEEGLFNSNNSCNLRVKDFINLLLQESKGNLV